MGMGYQYMHSDSELRTGLGVPATPFWASCDVVVRRSSNASGLAGRRRAANFSVVLSRAELLETDNECLWREVTAHVPFAEWVRLEVMQKDWLFGARRVRRVANWRPWHSPACAGIGRLSARPALRAAGGHGARGGPASGGGLPGVDARRARAMSDCVCVSVCVDAVGGRAVRVFCGLFLLFLLFNSPRTGET
jgi:hypothetical protein